MNYDGKKCNENSINLSIDNGGALKKLHINADVFTRRPGFPSQKWDKSLSFLENGTLHQESSFYL
jgi:hypothetical protein